MQLPTRTRFCQKLYLAWLKCGWGWRGEGEDSEKSHPVPTLDQVNYTETT